MARIANRQRAWAVVAGVTLVLALGTAAQAVTITTLDDDFAAATIDTAKWSVMASDFEVGSGTYTADTTTNAGQLTIAGVNDIASYWGGTVVQSVNTFASYKPSVFSVDRVSQTGSGSAHRSSIWIKQTDGTYLHFAQNIGENGWQYNPNNTGGGVNIGSLDSQDGNGGQFEMQLAYIPLGGSNARIDMIVDGVVHASHTFAGNWENNVDFNVRMSGMARAAPTDTVSAVFDNVAVGTLIGDTVQTTQQTSTGFTVSGTDLIEGLTPTVVGNINAEEGVTTSDPSALTNGAFGTPGVSGGNASEVVAIHNNTTLTYELDLTGAPDGYNIDAINTYAGWNDQGRDEQSYTVLVSQVDDPSLFFSIDMVSYNPGDLSPSDTSVSVSSASLLPILSGVGAIRFSFGSLENGYVGFREFDVFGYATVPEPGTVALTVMGLAALARRRRRRTA
ncbi:PEP-CTERM sorting domain-containing protein [bacterium]|nr:PEP-CTERM sorting domain-containing protein [bacterium]